MYFDVRRGGFVLSPCVLVCACLAGFAHVKKELACIKNKSTLIFVINNHACAIAKKKHVNNNNNNVKAQY